MLTLRPLLVSICITVLILVRIFGYIFVLIFVLSVRIKQVILFVWTYVFKCSNNVNMNFRIAISTF